MRRHPRRLAFALLTAGFLGLAVAPAEAVAYTGIVKIDQR